jgi:hypothetical protein
MVDGGEFLVPKTNNDKADYISCIIDYGDWSVVYELFVFGVPIGTNTLKIKSIFSRY